MCGHFTPLWTGCGGVTEEWVERESEWHVAPDCGRESYPPPQNMRFCGLPTADLRSVVDADLNEATLLVVEDAVVSELPVAVVVELHSPREALRVLG